jgi:hypothetical protein
LSRPVNPTRCIASMGSLPCDGSTFSNYAHGIALKP